MAQYHTQGTQHAHGVSAGAPPPLPRPSGELTAPVPPAQHPLIAVSKTEASQRRIAEIDSLLNDSTKGHAGPAKAEAEGLLKHKSGAYMLWFPGAAWSLSTFEEIKAGLLKYGFDENAGK